jgi:hypothetical protein
MMATKAEEGREQGMLFTESRKNKHHCSVAQEGD